MARQLIGGIVRNRCYLFILVFIACMAFSLSGAADSAVEIELDAPAIWVKGTPFSVGISSTDPLASRQYSLLADGLELKSGILDQAGTITIDDLKFDQTGRKTLEIRVGNNSNTVEMRVIHGLLTLVPPLIAIGLALIFRQVLASLWISIWVGALIVYDWHPVVAIARSIDHYILNAMIDPGDAAMLLFIIFMGGLIGMISKSGGIQGIVEILAKRATSTVRAQLSTWFMGLLIFFDDYANTIIVGNAMRPITDRLKISREKLAYIVDSTSAPVASIFPISTWIGYEVGLIDKALDSIGSGESGYMVFLSSIPFRFYPIGTLAMGLIISCSGRDFGPRLKAEKRARKGKPLRDGAIPMASLDDDIMEPPPGAPLRWYNAMIPILVVVGVTFGGLWINGKDGLGEQYAEVLKASTEYGWAWSKVYILGQVFSGASPNIVLCWSSLIGCIVAVLMIVGQRIMSLSDSMAAWLGGVKSMVIAIVVLLLAWSLGAVCQDLHTADFLTNQMAGMLSPRMLPMLVFILSAVISFSIGTSYGTMAILIPLVVPIADQLSRDAGFVAADTHMILVGAISSVLAGSVFGDHCSPISDTTIMSSMSSASDHVDHVRTQLPYAAVCGLVGIFVGDLLSAFGLHPLLSIALGIGIIYGIVRVWGKFSVEEA